MANSRPESVAETDRIEQADEWFGEVDKDIESLRGGGHGRLDADMWFLGMEKAGGGEVYIGVRLKFRPVEDNAEVHKMLGVTHLHWGRRKIQRTWSGMCNIMLWLEGKEPVKEHIRWDMNCAGKQRPFLTTSGGNL